VAEFDRVIPPGGEGKVKLSVDTKGYQGKFSKRATVVSNDPKMKMSILYIRAFVKVPISLAPTSVYFYGAAGKKFSRVVEIKAELEKPLRLDPSEFNLDGIFSYTLIEIEQGRKFHIRFENISEEPGNHSGFLKLKTNYSEKPEITIKVKGRFVETKGA
jgi:hypothetical protein